MWVLVLEALLALGLLLFIVWWTMAPAHKREQDEVRRARDEKVHSRDPAASGNADEASHLQPNSESVLPSSEKK